MAKTGRPGKGDERERKTARIVADVPPSQKEKLKWLAIRLKMSIAELIGGWIDEVFAKAGGRLDGIGLAQFLTLCSEGRPPSDIELLAVARDSGVKPEVLMKVRDCLTEDSISAKQP